VPLHGHLLVAVFAAECGVQCNSCNQVLQCVSLFNSLELVIGIVAHAEPSDLNSGRTLATSLEFSVVRPAKFRVVKIGHDHFVLCALWSSGL
jgi:hypothetical protein